MHDHDHPRVPHHHATSHAPASFGTAFAVGIALNTAFILIEAGFGIASNSVAPVADAEVYDPRTGTWRLTGRMATARAGASAVVLPSGAVLVSGGDEAGSAELYTGR